MPSAEGEERTILGIRFFIGTAAEAVERIRVGDCWWFRPRRR
jgi:hypothetical protein